MGDDSANYETSKESSSNTAAAGFYQGASTSKSALQHLPTTPKEPSKTIEVLNLSSRSFVTRKQVKYLNL